ncbi:MAG: response regulator, partial [Candidatus Altiarchaeales archaeon]|nr:response regulator [Candidatus Altiarchaeales archaeon]
MKETKTKGLVLLIDDDPDTVRLIGTLLEKEGYTTTSALNGKQGLRKVYEENPDLILIDIKLPDIDGNEVLKNIKETNPNRPVIMMTAYADIDNAILALKLGADDYIKKPFDNTHLTHTINRTYEAMTLRKEKKILKQRVTKLLKKKLKLTHNDKLTLYGLAQHPNASDITLSKKLGIPRTTITGIKNKLRKKQFYRKINTPNLPKLGCELLTLSYIKFNPSGIINERKTHTKKILKQPELIYAQST